jgi:lipopolysaccharide transport system permease protein
MRSAINPRANFQAFREISLLLTKHRQLTWEMARREISDRYQGQFFGLFWAIGHPLILIAVYVFVFSFVFNIKIGGTRELPRDYITYLLSGMIPWIAFQESMNKAGTVIINNANLVKQVVFPVEILPVKGVLSTLFTQVILTGLLVVYTLLKHDSLPITYLLWPCLISNRWP